MSWIQELDKTQRAIIPALRFCKVQGTFDIVFSAEDKVGPVEGSIGLDADPATQAEVSKRLHLLGLFPSPKLAFDFLRIDAPSLDGDYQCDAVLDTLCKEAAESDFMDDSVTTF